VDETPIEAWIEVGRQRAVTAAALTTNVRSGELKRGILSWPNRNGQGQRLCRIYGRAVSEPNPLGRSKLSTPRTTTERSDLERRSSMMFQHVRAFGSGHDLGV
jgi:hypothetical protein